MFHQQTISPWLLAAMGDPVLTGIKVAYDLAIILRDLQQVPSSARRYARRLSYIQQDLDYAIECRNRLFTTLTAYPQGE